MDHSRVIDLLNLGAEHGGIEANGAVELDDRDINPDQFV
jgi:hypothetical protein